MRTAPPPTDLELIVVGVDGSEPSKAAVRWAARLGSATGAKLEAVIAWHFPQTYGWPVLASDWHPDVDARKVLDDALDEALGADRLADIDVVVAEGNARDVLIAASAHAQLLVVGSRGHGGFAGLLLGSVSTACAEHARCPVLVVHAEQPRP